MCDYNKIDFYITPFKDRFLNLNDEVEIYRCLHRNGYVYSIRQNNLVVGHTSNIDLYGVRFKILKCGKEKAIRTGIRNVHAVIIGLININPPEIDFIPSESNKLTYNPFSNEGFMCNGLEVNSGNFLTIRSNNLFLY